MEGFSSSGPDSYGMLAELLRSTPSHKRPPSRPKSSSIRVSPYQNPFDKEVISLIARCLVDNRDFNALAALNRTSRVVHEETLPVLYQWMTLDWGGYFEHLTAETFPKGWRYTKYLNLTSSTWALLKQHQCFIRFIYNQDSKPKIDMSETFPRLVYMSVRTEQPAHPAVPTRLEIALFKPIEIDDLARLASPVRTFHHPTHGLVVPPPTRKQLLQDMKTLHVRKGGSLLFTCVADESRARRLASLRGKSKELDSPALSVHVESDVPAEVEATFKAVFKVIRDTRIESEYMDIPSISMYRDNVGRTGIDGTLPIHLKCHTAVMDTLVASFSESYHLIFEMTIDILDQESTADQMKKWISDFGDIYDHRWDRGQDRKFAELVEITAPIPSDARHAKVSSTRNIQGIRYGVIRGNLDYGRRRGFLTGVYEGYIGRGGRVRGKDQVKGQITVEELVCFCDS